MRFLVDECLFARLVQHLRRDGHDVHWVKDDMRSADDATVLAVANAERRLVMSEDRDFGALVFRDQAPALGIVSVRVSEFDFDPENMADYVTTRVRELGDGLLGQFTVIEPGGERPRPLPNVLP